jgi:hypothetical protein
LSTLTAPPAPPLHLTRTAAVGLAELAAICARPLPDIPDHWLTNRWHRGVWSARTDAILTHPAYRDFYTWSAATHPRRHEHWELMAAVAVTHAQRVAAGHLPVEDLAGLIRRTWRSRTLAPRRQYLLYDPVALADRLPDRPDRPPLAVAVVLAGRRSASAPDHHPQQAAWPVIDWMLQAVGPGWLTPAARTVLEDSLTLVADFADTHPGFAAPAASVSRVDRITSVLAHLPRPARQAVRALIFGPTDKTALAGATNSLIVLAAENGNPRDLPANLVALWRYYAVSLDPQLGLVLAETRVARRRLQRTAARHPLDQPVHIEAVLGATPEPAPPAA